MLIYSRPLVITQNDEKTSQLPVYSINAYKRGIINQQILSLVPYMSQAVLQIPNCKTPTRSELTLSNIDKQLATWYINQNKNNTQIKQKEIDGSCVKKDNRVASLALSQYLRLSRDMMATQATRLLKLRSGIKKKEAKYRRARSAKQ